MTIFRKENLKDSLYLIEQAESWLVWHGTLNDLNKSLFWGVKGIEIIEYVKGDLVQRNLESADVSTTNGIEQ